MPYLKKSEKYLFETQRVKLKEVTVHKLGTDETLLYEVIEREPAVAVLAFIDKYNILLVKQYRVPVDSMTLDLPGGGVNYSETPLEAATRELEEEVGYQAKNWEELVTYYPDSGRTEGIKTIFLAQDLVKTSQKLDETEDIEIIKMSFKELTQIIQSDEPKEHTLLVAMGAYLTKFTVS